MHLMLVFDQVQIKLINKPGQVNILSQLLQTPQNAALGLATSREFVHCQESF